MRVGLLPRETASAIMTGAVASMGWAGAAALLVLSVPMLVETMVLRGRAGDLPIPLLLIAVLLAGIGLVALRPRPWVVVLYLVVCGAVVVAYQVVLLSGDPALLDDALYLVNRPLLALVAVGVSSTTALVGIGWSVLGFGVAIGAGSLAALIAAVPFRPGLGPALVLGVAVIAYLTLEMVQMTRRRRVPDFEELERETRAVAFGEDLARRSTAVVHDTVLNDLAVVMSAPDRLDERVRERLLADLETLRSEEWMRQTSDTTPLSDLEADLRNENALAVSEYQWMGLSIHVSGAGLREHRMSPEVRVALIAALRACLENVVSHSGAASAEIELMADEAQVTLMVTDQGSGFDLAEVAPDRLGLRASVVERMEAVGGRVQIWTAPGSGTSVIITAPVLSPELGATE